MSGTGKTTGLAAVAWLLVVALIIGSTIAGFFFIDVVERFINGIAPYLAKVSIVVLIVDLLICLPLVFFRWGRVASMLGFQISSWIIGLITFAAGFTITYLYWGRVGVFVGLFLIGIGVVPTGLLAALLNRDWSQLVDLLILIVMYILTSAGALLGGVMQQREDARR